MHNMKFYLFLIILMPLSLFGESTPQSGGISKDGFSSIMILIISALAIYWIVMKYSNGIKRSNEDDNNDNNTPR